MIQLLMWTSAGTEWMLENLLGCTAPGMGSKETAGMP